MYQIFPDRFFNSKTPKKNVPKSRVMRDWGDTPFWKEEQMNGIWDNDYFGGDLKGIEKKLSYIADLGVTCIYLNPIFEAHENHRYNTANYRKVDPLLGTNDDFKELCKESKKRGINVILDGVFSLYHHHRKRSACETKHYPFSCLFNSLCINVYLHRNYVRNSFVYPNFHYIVIDLKKRHFENSLINTIFAKLIQNTNDRNSTTRMDQCYRVRPFPIQTQFKRGMAIPRFGFHVCKERLHFVF